MNVPKLHHYLAEAYLKRFTDENGDLWVLNGDALSWLSLDVDVYVPGLVERAFSTR